MSPVIVPLSQMGKQRLRELSENVQVTLRGSGEARLQTWGCLAQEPQFWGWDSTTDTN